MPRRVRRHLTALFVVPFVLSVSACSFLSDSDGPPSASAQREGLDSAWAEDYSDTVRRELCEAYQLDRTGTLESFQGDFDLDVVDRWLQDKC